jgi:16S rRNA (cytosine967-C5)-methyltransferase
VGELAGLQRALLRDAARALRPGGTLLYSVCTLTRDETIAVDEWAATELPELVALPPPAEPWRPWKRGALLLPHVAGTDGMFVLRLQRTHRTRER